MRRATKILVIDDEKEIIDSLTGYFGARGYDVISATDGEGGIEKMKLGPNIVFLDIMMPGMDGYEVLRRIRNSIIYQYTPIVMLTAKSESSSIFRSQDLRATDYIIKPFKLESLLELVKRHT